MTGVQTCALPIYLFFPRGADVSVCETKLVRDNAWPTVLLLAVLLKLSNYAEIMLLGQDINLPPN